MGLASVFLFSFLLCLLAANLPDSWNIKPQKNFRRQHSNPSLLGGLSIYLSLVIYNFWNPNSFIETLLVSSIPLVVVGFLDDLLEISPRWKFVGQIAAGFIWFYLTPYSEIVFGQYGQLICYALITFWILSICSSINFIDGLDGHVGTFFIVSSVFLSTLHSELPLLLVTVSVLGFLVMNLPKAKIYLGEVGSSFLGFSFAIYTSTQSHYPQSSHIIGSLFIISYCLIDILYAVIRRKKRGVPVFSSDKDHIHHKFLKVGLTHWQTLACTFALTALCGLLGNVILHSTGWNLLIYTLGSITIMLSFFFSLLKIENKKNNYLKSLLVDESNNPAEPDFELDLSLYTKEFNGFNKSYFLDFVSRLKSELSPSTAVIQDRKLKGFFNSSNTILSSETRISLIIKNIIKSYNVALDDNAIPTGLVFKNVRPDVLLTKNKVG